MLGWGCFVHIEQLRLFSPAEAAQRLDESLLGNFWSPMSTEVDVGDAVDADVVAAAVEGEDSC